VTVTVADEQDADHKPGGVSYLNLGDFFGEMGLFGGEEEDASQCRRDHPRTEQDRRDFSYERFMKIKRRSSRTFSVRVSPRRWHRGCARPPSS
jgi:CRP/FNR family cyclic AMP-dependent transcriptional regulator